MEYPLCLVLLGMKQLKCELVWLLKCPFYHCFQVSVFYIISFQSFAYLFLLYKDEIKHLIGSETTREGVLRIFELFQNPVLYRRLLFVIFEGVIDALFPENNIDELFEKFHVESSN